MQSKATHLHERVPPGWYFDSISTNLLQRFWHKRRFEEIKKLVEPVSGQILDIGSADGVFTEVVLEASKASGVIGIDVLEESVEWANKFWDKNSRMKFLVGDAQHLDFEAETFDAVFALEVMEHVYEPVKALQEIKRVLKKEGYALILVPTDNAIFRFIWFFWTRFRGSIWRGTHVQSYRNNQLIEILRDADFVIEQEKKFMFQMLLAVKIRRKN